MNKFLILIFFVMTSLKLWAETKEQVQKKLNFSAGHYEVIVPEENPTDFCETEELDIDLIDDKSEITMAFGNEVSFSRLEAAQFNDETAPGCKTQYKNSIKSNLLEQTRTEKCGKKTYTKKYLVEFDKDNIQITLEEKKNKKTCTYKFKKQKG